MTDATAALSLRLQAEISRSVQKFLDEFAHHVNTLLCADTPVPASHKNGKSAPPRTDKVRRSHKLSEDRMRCQEPGCTERSKGPRFHYRCAKHLDVKQEVQRQAAKKTPQKKPPQKKAKANKKG